MIRGQILHRLAARVCCAKSLERIVEPAIADLQREQGIALLGNYLAVLKVLAICAFDISGATDDDRPTVKRTLAWAGVFTGVLTVVFVLPPLFAFSEVRSWFVALLLLPQALPLAIPIGLAFAVAVGLGRPVTRNVRNALLLTAVIGSLLSLGALIWGMPAGNQGFRTLVAEAARSDGELIPASPSKGPNEMWLSELNREVANLTAIGDHRHAQQYSWTFHLRFALALAVLAVVGFLLTIPVNGRWSRGLIAFVTCVAYWALMYAGEFAMQRDYMTPFAGAWLPNMVLALATIVILSYSTRRDLHSLTRQA